jgi:hypothetical protein
MYCKAAELNATLQWPLHAVTMCRHEATFFATGNIVFLGLSFYAAYLMTLYGDHMASMIR